MTPFADRRQTILQATLDLVAEVGLVGTTIALIAKRAQASPGIIYHYFESKDEIIHTLYRQVHAAYGEAILQDDLFQRSWLERMKAIWLATFHYYTLHPQEAIFLEQYKNSTYGLGEFSLDDDGGIAALARMALQDMADGRMVELPLEAIYAMTVGVAISLAKFQISGHVNFDEATLDRIAETSCRALAAS